MQKKQIKWNKENLRVHLEHHFLVHLYHIYHILHDIFLEKDKVMHIFEKLMIWFWM